jgi:hypothetical protein
MFDIDSAHPSIPTGVNNSSEVAVNIDATNTGTYRAFYWNSSGVKQQLGSLGGGRTFLNSINESGYTTGWSERSGKNVATHAFLWHLSIGIRDLNLLKAASDASGIELTSGIKINNLGQILARGVKKNVGVSVLLKPAP